MGDCLQIFRAAPWHPRNGFSIKKFGEKMLDGCWGGVGKKGGWWWGMVDGGSEGTRSD